MKKVWVKFKCKKCGEMFWERLVYKDKLTLDRFWLTCQFCKHSGTVHNEFFIVKIEESLIEKKETFWQKIKRWLGIW
jgi:hypothetical protein